MELEEEKEKRKKNASKNAAKMQQLSMMNEVIGRWQRCSPKEGETTPLSGRQSDDGGDDNGYGTRNNTGIGDNDQTSLGSNTGWFDQLVAIVTGKPDDDQQEQKQEEQEECECDRI